MARLQPHRLGTITPMPATVKRCAAAGACLRRCMTAWAKGCIGWRRPAKTARLLVTASPWAASGRLPWSAACVHAGRRWALRRPPVWRPRLLGSLSLWAGCWRPVSRTARSACGEMSPLGHTPRRNPGANPRASAWSSVYCRLLYGGIAAGLARGTRSSASSHPSTRQSQGEVDSPTTPVRAT
jgi:hypothetical protein